MLLVLAMAACFDLSLQSLNRLVASEESYREVKELFQSQNGRDEERPAGQKSKALEMQPPRCQELELLGNAALESSEALARFVALVSQRRHVAEESTAGGGGASCLLTGRCRAILRSPIVARVFPGPLSLRHGVFDAAVAQKKRFESINCRPG